MVIVRKHVIKMVLMSVVIAFAGCGKSIQITSPGDGTVIALAGQTQQTFNVSTSNNDFSGAQISIYSVNPSITGTCNAGNNYGQCVIQRATGASGGVSCSTQQPCDVLLTVASGNIRDRVLLKVSF